MLYYAGFLLEHYASDPPIVVRGFDEAGNPLISIRAAPRITPNSVEGAYIYFDCYSVTGIALSNYVVVGSVAPYGWVPDFVAQRHDGVLFCNAKAFPAFAPSLESSRLVTLDFLRVFNPAGDRIPFPQLHGAQIHAIAFGEDSTIYVGGEEHHADRIHLRKYSADGATLLWSVSSGRASGSVFSESVREIAVGPDGGVYVLGWLNDGAAYPLGGFLAKYTSSGAEAFKFMWLGGPAVESAGPYTDDAGWLGNFGHRPKGIAIDEAGDYFYTHMALYQEDEFGARTALSSIQQRDCGGGSITGYDSYGTDLPESYYWQNNIPDLYYSDGTLYAGQRYLTNTNVSYSIATYSAIDMTPIASLFIAQPPGARNTSGAWSDALIYHSNDRRVSAGFAYHFPAHDASGTDLWESLSMESARGVRILTGEAVDDSYPGYLAETYTNAYGQTAGPDVTSSLADASAIEAYAPYGSFYEPGTLKPSVYWYPDPIAPSIKLGLGLGLYTWVGDQNAHPDGVPLPLSLAAPWVRREYAGPPPMPWAYSASLSGSPALAVPISSMQIRREARAHSVTLVVPSTGAAMLEGIAARASGTLTIGQGVRFPSGESQIDDMLSASITGIRYDTGERSSSVSISASGEYPEAPVSVRELRGISYRSNAGGRRTVRCGVDPLLYPGDTALLPGGEELTVVSVSFSISPSSATMEVSE